MCKNYSSLLILCLFSISTISLGQTNSIREIDFLQRNENRGCICGCSNLDDPIIRHIDAIINAIETYMEEGSVTVSIKEASDGNTSGSWWSPYSFNYDIVETLLTENNEYVALNFSSGNMCTCHAEWMSLNGN